MSFFSEQDKEFYHQLSPDIKLDLSGTVFLRLENGETIGLSAYSVADLLNISLNETKNVMREAVRIAISTKIQDAIELSNILIGIIDLVEDGELGHHSSFPTASIPNYERQSLISLKDIAQSLQITTEFAKELFHEYKRPISDEADLKNFMEFVASYLVNNHGGAMPQDVRKIHVKKSKPTQPVEFTPERINKILAQEAPKELRAETEFDKEIHIYELKNILAKLLDISPEDAGIIVSSPENLQEFMYLSTIAEATDLLESAYKGNYKPLIDLVEERIISFLQESSQDASEQTSSPPLTEEQENTLGKKISFTDEPSDILDPSELIGDLAGGTIEVKTPEITQLPESITGQLKLCFALRGRVTSKSMSDIFRNMGCEISQTLAKFIIENGKYGAEEGENTKRIITESQLNRLIKDIEESGGLKSFISFYLKRVNEQVHTMFYGKPR